LRQIQNEPVNSAHGVFTRLTGGVFKE